MGPGESLQRSRSRAAPAASSRPPATCSHCHIAEHYVAGMWGFWRVFNTRQPDLAPLPDRVAPPAAGRLARAHRPHDGRRHRRSRKDNLADWVKPQIPPPGVPQDRQDAAVWDWTRRHERPRPPAATSASRRTRGAGRTCPDVVARPPGRAARRPVRRQPPGDPLQPGRRPTRVPAAAPEHRPAAAVRAQRALRRAVPRRATPNAASSGTANPFAKREDGLCPAGAPDADVQRGRDPVADPGDDAGATTHGQDLRPGQEQGRRPRWREDGRAAGDPRPTWATASQSRSPRELEPEAVRRLLARSNMHIHHVQFDARAPTADVGLVYEQSIRPYTIEDPKLDRGRRAGQRRRSRSTSVGEVPAGASGSPSASALRASRSTRSRRSTPRPRRSC